ncbi:MAG: NADH-quinone oxidoreductase subunit A [Candidatus Methanoplasma sp.]|jgi:NADH-quinone oxidoreductase subunit A|nr:NADH-quinone oxidoreductase subunit A [Candidatus Methanoplasma sp.]
MSLVVSYIPLVVVGILAFGFAPLAWLISRFIRPSKPTQWMENTYECGSEPIGDAHVQFRFQYYAFAIIFVVFDLVATFLMVWSVAYSGLSTMATVWMLLFLSILILGVAYALKKEETVWI